MRFLRPLKNDRLMTREQEVIRFVDSQNPGQKTPDFGFWDTRSRMWPFGSFLSPSIERLSTLSAGAAGHVNYLVWVIMINSTPVNNYLVTLCPFLIKGHRTVGQPVNIFVIPRPSVA